jgi:putative SOS response-associated peptidase YedK
MRTQPTSFDIDAPEGDRRPLIRLDPDGGLRPEMIEAVWGSNPRFSDGVNYRFVRAGEGAFGNNRGLVAVSEFHMTVGKKRYRVKLENGDFFYLAAIWEPAMAGWPVCFRIITVYANREVSDYQQRHGAVIPRPKVRHWLDNLVSASELLVTPPAGTFVVEEITSARRQPSLAL